MIKKLRLLLNEATQKTDLFEYEIIRTILQKEFAKKRFELVDVGSGLCNFPIYIRNQCDNSKISCLDINQDLVDLAGNLGFAALRAKITKLPYENESFDVTHCSHVIEHLVYPDIISAIDELIRVTKNNGLLIIRSPLWANHRFYNDIDHIRPYPPESIINYIKNRQQQSVSRQEIVEVRRWYTRIFFEINPHRYDGFLVKYLNALLKICWLFFSYPVDRPNNYGIVFRKLC